MNNQLIDLESLKAKNIPHAKASSFFAIEQDCDKSKAAMKEADEYFSHFVAGTPGGPCINCGKYQGAKDFASALLAGAQFTWGLAYGEGFCRNCGYPARAHHEIPGIGRFTNFILQYHPDELTLNPKETE